MRDLCLQSAGVIAVFTAIVHGVIGEAKIFSKSPYPGEPTRHLLRLIWQASTVDWIVLGILLFAAPQLGSPTARLAVVGAAVAAYGYAAIGNALASRGRHVGWMLMGAVVMLSIAGR